MGGGGGGARRPWRTLAARLFLSYLAIVAVGLATMAVAADLVAPAAFSAHMASMTAGVPPAMAARARELDAEVAGAFRAAMGQAMLVAGGAALATAVGASLFVATRVAAPVRRLATASQRIAAGRYAERVADHEGVAEVAELAASFNAMAAALEATERRRLELVGDVAHEMRTPIAALEGYLEGLLDGVVAPGDETWAKLHAEAGRLRRLVDDLQELSRAEAGQIPLRPRPADPVELARAAADRLAGQIEARGLAFALDAPAGLPSVLADPDRAVQVLTNLLTNALRYTPPPGQVTLGVRADGGALRFAVADTGVGIAAEDLPRVFERFYRVDKSRSRAPGAPAVGSGIGLTIARALVEAMGGRVWAESAGRGRGATFVVVLPAAPRLPLSES